MLRWRAALGALTFAGFSVLWTAVVFLLSGPAYGWQESTIGLLGLVGAAGSFAASTAGRLADRGWRTASPASARSCCWAPGASWRPAARAAPGHWRPSWPA
ncbi:hypothetical protein O1L55_17440 [Streptomyces albulus]|nr:hypothetical protein [Streptomyces noursei]